MMTKEMIEDFLEADFITVEHGEIIWHGYFYCEESWHTVEYCDFVTPIEDFVNKYHNDIGEAYEAVGQFCKQYGAVEDGGTYDEQWFHENLHNWVKGVTLISPLDINFDTPDGYYALKKGVSTFEKNCKAALKDLYKSLVTIEELCSDERHGWDFNERILAGKLGNCWGMSIDEIAMEVHQVAEEM